MPGEPEFDEHRRAAKALTETIDIDGARFAATKDAVQDIDHLDARVREWDGEPVDAGDMVVRWAEDDLNRRVSMAIRDGELVYQEPVPDMLFRVNGDTFTPEQRREVAMEESNEEARQEELRESPLWTAKEEVQSEVVEAGARWNTPQPLDGDIHSGPDPAHLAEMHRETLIEQGYPQTACALYGEKPPAQATEREVVAMPNDRYTVVREGQFYNTDKHTIEALRLIREWPNAAEEFFQRGLAEGRIHQRRPTPRKSA